MNKVQSYRYDSYFMVYIKKACPTCIGHFVFSEYRNASLLQRHNVFFNYVLILFILHTKCFT
jgi:hypothetical protein